MTFKRKILLGIILLLLTASSGLALKFYRQPLGPALELPASTQPRPTLTTVPTQAVVLSVESTATETTEVLPTQTVTPQPLCGGPAVMNILAIGSDARGQHYLYGLADVIRLVRVDFVNARVVILEVPRDLWVQIPGVGENRIRYHTRCDQSPRWLASQPGHRNSIHPNAIMDHPAAGGASCAF